MAAATQARRVQMTGDATAARHFLATRESIFSVALEDGRQARLQLPRKSHPNIPIRIASADAYEHEIPNQKSPLFYWALEFGRCFRNNKDPVLCVKAKCQDPVVAAKGISMAGIVVSVEVTINRKIQIILENVESHARYVRLTLDPAMYSISINIDWVLRNEYSAVQWGLLPPSLTMEKINAEQDSISPGDIIQGFQQLKAYMMGGDYSMRIPLSWMTSALMEKAGLFKDPYNLVLPRDEIFEDGFNEDVMNDWIKKQQSAKKRGKAKVVVTQLSDTEEAVEMAIVPYTGDDKEPLKDKPASKRRAAGAAPVVTEKRINSEPKAKVTSQSAGQAKKEPAPKKPRVAKEPKPKEAKKQKTGPSMRPTTSVSVDLFYDDETLENEKPDETLVKEGVEQGQKILPFYTWGDRVFHIPVECIVSPPSTLVYRCLSKDHAMEIAKSIVKHIDREGVYQVCD